MGRQHRRPSMGFELPSPTSAPQIATIAAPPHNRFPPPAASPSIEVVTFLRVVMVKVVVCPTVHVPDAVRGGAAHKQGQKRARGDMGWSEEASSYRAGGNNSSSSSGGGSGNKRGRFNDRDRGDGHELKALFSSVKDLSATALAGLKKKEHKEDKLTKLGAPPGASTIPFSTPVATMRSSHLISFTSPVLVFPPTQCRRKRCRSK